MKKVVPNRAGMIFITSNEDLINQICAKKSDATQMIDLDNDDEVETLGNPQNLSFLASLTGLVRDHFSLYNQFFIVFFFKFTKIVLLVLIKIQSNASKSAKKPADLVCVPCGDRAIGYNYDVLSCSPCKAFFFRNAHREPVTNRCRLDRCFQMGMRKDFLLSSE